MAKVPPPELKTDDIRRCLVGAGLADDFRSVDWHHIGRFSNDVWRLTLDNGVQLIGKSPFRPPRPQDPEDLERRFYPAMRELIADPVRLPIPRYVGQLDRVLLLEFESLRPFSFATGATEAHATAAIAALADWHASWWNEPPLLKWLPDFSSADDLASAQRNFDTAWATHADRLSTYAPEFRPLGEALVNHLATTLSADIGPMTFLHGDAHAENLPLTESDRILLLDWEAPRIGNPGYDLAVFMGMSFRQKDRPQMEKVLLDQYVDRVNAHGHTWTDPWLGYRLGLIRRVAHLVEISDLNFSSLPWVFRRAAMAAVEQDVGALIR